LVSPIYRGTASELSGEVAPPAVVDRERWFGGAEV
jgi:hypothetical protein